MMEKLFILVSFFIVVIAATNRPRGVSLEKASFYQEGKDFTCLTSGEVISFDFVNDDYCDCGDGSDEPGTSACSNGLYHCENKGYKGTYVKSSRVNDAICDCCDGSDEFEGLISCPNTCMDIYEKERAQEEVLRHKQAEGFKVKQEYMQQGQRARDEKLAKLAELENEKGTLSSDKEAAEAAKTEAEEPETIAKEEHKKAWEAEKEEKKKAKEAIAAAQAFSALDVNQDGSVDYPEMMKRLEFDINSDGTVSEEEAKEYLEDKEQADLALFTEKIWPNIKEILKLEEAQPVGEGEGTDIVEEHTKDAEGKAETEIPISVVEGGSPDHHIAGDFEDNEEGDDNRYEEEDHRDDDDEEEDDDDEDDDDSTYAKSSDNKDVTEEDNKPEYNEETKRLIAAADLARTRFYEAERKLKDSDRDIDEIKKYLETDYGPNQEYAALEGQCFEYTDREYTYKLCPFEKTTQKNKNGGIETSLGMWGKWLGSADDKYDAMKYENGQGCWNGPSRSTHVNLHCGPVNEVTSSSEPSRCEYQFEFTTPAKCDQPKPASTSRDIHEEL